MIWVSLALFICPAATQFNNPFFSSPPSDFWTPNSYGSSSVSTDWSSSGSSGYGSSDGYSNPPSSSWSSSGSSGYGSSDGYSEPPDGSSPFIEASVAKQQKAIVGGSIAIGSLGSLSILVVILFVCSPCIVIGVITIIAIVLCCKSSNGNRQYHQQPPVGVPYPYSQHAPPAGQYGEVQEFPNQYGHRALPSDAASQSPTAAAAGGMAQYSPSQFSVGGGVPSPTPQYAQPYEYGPPPQMAGYGPPPSGPPATSSEGAGYGHFVEPPPTK